MGKYIKQVKMVEYDDKKIYGTVYLPDKEGKHPVVIFSHGYNCNGEIFKGYAEFLASNGVAAYCYDFCGGSVNSRSSLKTTEMTISSEKNDLEEVINHVKQWDMIDKDNIFLFGASQGGLVSSLVAENHCNDINGLILIYPAFCIAENWTEKYKDINSAPDEVEFNGMTIGKTFIEDVYNFDTMAHLGKYDKDVLIIHGDKDPVVSYKYSVSVQKLYKHAKLNVFPGEGHGFSPEGDKKAAEMALEFVQSNIVD